MLVTMKQILDAAREGGYGVTAPNVNNEDTVCAAIEAAEECHAPMIIDVGFTQPTNRSYVKFGRMVEEIAKEARVPVAINQDHGREYAHAIWAIRAGFTSIMVDRSELPYEDNVAQVSELSKIAHAVGVSVESELGHVGQGSQYAIDRDAALTDPTQAKDFVQRTGVDCLAVAIGTAHGVYTGTPYLDFPLLHKIYREVSVPLVLHGGSGTGDENLAKATREGISKVNLATDLYLGAMHFCHDQGCSQQRKIYDFLKKGYKDKLIHYMKLFDQCNRA